MNLDFGAGFAIGAAVAAALAFAVVAERRDARVATVTQPTFVLCRDVGATALLCGSEWDGRSRVTIPEGQLDYWSANPDMAKVTREQQKRLNAIPKETCGNFGLNCQ